MSKKIELKVDPLDLLSETLVKETFKLVDAQANDAKERKRLYVLFLAKFVGIMVYRSLVQPAPQNVVKKRILQNTRLRILQT